MTILYLLVGEKIKSQRAQWLLSGTMMTELHSQTLLLQSNDKSESLNQYYSAGPNLLLIQDDDSLSVRLCTVVLTSECSQ